MWTLFKIINFIWLMSSTYMWMTTYMSLTPIVFFTNVMMIICMGFLPVQIRFDKAVGRILLFLSALVVWSVYKDGPVMGIFIFLSYLPVVWLIMLPKNYLEDLLNSVTKWYAILLGIGLVEYFVLLFMSLPNIGVFNYEGYKPYINYVFYIKTTYDYETLERFNAFFLEPGHQALLSTFLLIANSFKFRKNPYNYILLLSIICSFSLAGYLLTAIAASSMFIKNMTRTVVVVGMLTAFIVISLSWNKGDNDLNELIVGRLEYDESKGIKGNNRFFNNTDYVFERAVKSGDAWYGVQDKVNMELVGGAGFKIYAIKYGWIGAILVALFYLALIPSNVDKKYATTFFIVMVLCFMQRSYPAWYSWLLPYVIGLYINRKGDDNVCKVHAEGGFVGF